MSETKLLYRIALSDLPGIGDINARKLIDYLGDPEAIFREPYRSLVKIPGIGSKLAGHISENRSLARAEKELEFITRYKIGTSYYQDNDYPEKLKECPDSPILLFYKGDIHPLSKRVISVIGTRNATRRGKEICNEIIASLATNYSDVVIVSGLAYGIDITAHKAALKNNLPTIGVMAHGFATLYPSVHTPVAREMLERGGLITDFFSDEPPDRNNFLKRNRIIAGMADATLVIESGLRGGAMVTADMAVSYSRDLFAVPGFPGEKYSEGCNLLIKSNRASLVEKSEDIGYYMSWENRDQKRPEPTLFNDLSPIEKAITDLLTEHHQLTADSLSEMLNIPVQRLSASLLSLQFAGHIKALPGNIFRIRG